MAWSYVLLWFSPFALISSLFIALQMDGLLGAATAWIVPFLAFYIYLMLVLLTVGLHAVNYYRRVYLHATDVHGVAGNNKWMTRDEMAIVCVGAALLLTMLILLNVRLDTGAPPYWVVFIPLQTLALILLVYYTILLFRIGLAPGESQPVIPPPPPPLREEDVTERGSGAAAPFYHIFSLHRERDPEAQRKQLVILWLGSVILAYFSVFITLTLQGAVSNAWLYVPVMSALTLLLVFVVVFLMWTHNGTIKIDKYPWWQVWPLITAILGISLFMLIAYLKVFNGWTVLWTVVFVPFYVTIGAMALMFLYTVWDQNPKLMQRYAAITRQMDENDI